MQQVSGRMPIRSVPERAHDGEEILVRLVAQHGIGALLLADGGRPGGRVVVPGEQLGFVGQRAEHVVQAAVHVLRARARPVDTTTPPHEERVARTHSSAAPMALRAPNEPPRWSGWKCVTRSCVMRYPSASAVRTISSMSHAASTTAA